MESNLAKNLGSLSITPVDDDDGRDGEEDIDMESSDDGFDDDEDEKEDEEGRQSNVRLGFVEKPRNPQLLLRHAFPCKAGGFPAWLDPVNLPSEKSQTCGFCGEPLQFLLQIYAPYDDKEYAFHRTLYVFMCPSMACLLRDQHEQWRHKEGNRPRSVKVFRCQLPRFNPYYSSEASELDGTAKPLSTGAPLCRWCGTWKGEKLCGRCKKARYCSQKHQALHWNSGHKSECHKLIVPDSSVIDNGNGIEDLKVSKIGNDFVAIMTDHYKAGPSKAGWPEYVIVTGDECASELEKSEGNSLSVGSSAIVSNYNKTDEALQSVMDQFEADADKRSWASFQERISRAPEQVLRYCRDKMAKPLWPFSSGRPSKAEIPPCHYCKGPLDYEFQIMPQLLYYFDVKNDKSSLDWETIAVYTCSKSCESSISYKEELAWVQLYPATS